MKLGKNLRRLRTAQKISRQQLADSLNLSYSTICKYETGTRTPDFDSLLKIANFFSVSTDELLDVRPMHLADDDSDVIALPYTSERETICCGIPEKGSSHLNDEELHVLKLYRNLESDYKVTVRNTLESFVRMSKNKLKK